MRRALSLHALLTLYTLVSNSCPCPPSREKDNSVPLHYLLLVGLYTPWYLIVAPVPPSREKDNSVPLHYLLLVGLLLLFSSCLPFLFPVSQLMCALRPALPGIAFAIILSRYSNTSHFLVRTRNEMREESYTCALLKYKNTNHVLVGTRI